MNYVVWDIETDSAQLDWATMIEIGAILLDEILKKRIDLQQDVECPKTEFHLVQLFA